MAFNAVFSSAFAFFSSESDNDFWANTIKLFILNWILRVLIAYELKATSDYYNEKMAGLYNMIDSLKSFSITSEEQIETMLDLDDAVIAI